jgi:23S rRNA (adenine2030-N6)-methyltransferase
VNYRHAFHAGNFADVHKHVILLALIERLKRKPTPFFYLDTHAGRGRYDLNSEEARRSSEWRYGIGRLLSTTPRSQDIRNYLAAVAAIRPHGEPRYPGSPLIAANAMRRGDRAVLIEQQQQEARAIEIEMRGRRKVSVQHSDGYAALKAYLPPKENRGLVLIDPPYESPREFATVEQALRFGLSRWPNGMFALWYPIKLGPEAQRFLDAVRASGLRKLLTLELSIRPADSPLGLNGSGMLIANPPWQLDVEMREATTELHSLLSPDGAGTASVEWLVPE